MEATGKFGKINWQRRASTTGAAGALGDCGVVLARSKPAVLTAALVLEAFSQVPPWSHPRRRAWTREQREFRQVLDYVAS